MGVKLDLYNDYVTAITAVTTIKTRGLWNSQTNWEREEIPFAYPATFLEFTTIVWATTKLKSSKGASTGNIINQQQSSPDSTIITIHIVFEKLKRATLSFPEIEPIIDEVYNALQCMQGDYYSPLLRVEERQDADHARVIDWQMDFSVNLFEQGKRDTDLTDANDPIGTLTDMEITRDLEIDNDIIRSGDI